MAVNLYILNANGSLSEHLEAINTASQRASKAGQESLKLEKVDIIFRDASSYAIPELGIGGFTTDDGYAVYISLDPKKGFKTEALYSQLLHELYHAKRFQEFGWPQNLAGNLVSEGLACLFEEQTTNQLPIYCQVKITQPQIKIAQRQFFNKNYDHDEWFFGTKKLPRWFGYSYGYQICKNYSVVTRKSASDLALSPVDMIIKG